MASAYFFVFIVFSHLVLLCSAEEEERQPKNCPSFPCGKFETIGFPFSHTKNPDCGLFVVDCTEPNPKIQLEKGGKWYQVTSISQGGTIIIRDQVLIDHLRSRNCSSFNLTLPSSSFFSFFTPNLTLFQCNRSLNFTPPPTDFNYTQCNDKYNIYYNDPNHTLPSFPPQCSIIQLPLKKEYLQTNSADLFSLLAEDISLGVQVSQDCYQCNLNGGQCIDINRKFQCANATKASVEGKNNLGLKLSLGIGCPVIIIICLFLFLRRYYRQKYASSDFLSRNISSNLSSKSDLERSSVYFSVPIFSYTELEEATNNFDPTKELGDGGFGTVYHGKLQDGREVAVKRLYENNYKRVQQFMNEVEILTRLHHKNLVSLYGCTSRHSRELLLVYEFIPNGTVADHLHGNRVKPGSLTWPIRMNIAIETAEALAYLHASDIVHRDVKTNNLLLDNNFCVKVADFGLSRLFPTDATHVSTAPQGTPGYVDPEYHQCYRLTDKSDVYSFGVVLIELISSMPAVDMSRHNGEINLANLAINKIKNCAFNELVDPCLGFESNLKVRIMTTLVAELAFRCLQQDKEIRPSMDEVLDVLKGIKSEKYAEKKIEEVDDDVGVLKIVKPPPSPDSDHVRLLKIMRPPRSPISVTEKWVSRSSTTGASVEAFPTYSA